MNRPEGSESSGGGERRQAAWKLHCNSSSLHIAATDNTIRSFKHKQDGQLSHHIRRIPKTHEILMSEIERTQLRTPVSILTPLQTGIRFSGRPTHFQTLHTTSRFAVGTKDAFPLDVLKRTHSLEFSAEVINAWSLTSIQTSLWHNVYQAYG